MSGKEQKASSGTGTPITPVPIAAAAPLDDESLSGTVSKLQRVAVLSTSIVLFFVLLTVIFVLPRYVGTDPPRVESSAAPIEAGVGEDDPDIAAVETQDPKETAASRRHSQAQLEEALALVAQLESSNVEGWAAAEFGLGVNEVTVGEKAYREQRYLDAQRAYAKAIEILRAAEGRADEVVARAIDEGFFQIASGDSTAAARSFRFALDIEPDNEEAKRGLTRTETLDQVLALVNEAEGYERLGELKKAVQRYREALSLDAEAPGASSAIARIEQIQLDTEFRRLMSEGFAAFETQRNVAAKSAFERARKMKPEAAEAGAALAQVENQILANKISKRLSAALTLEGQEKWEESAKQYRSAVRLDADLDGAAASAKRADKRAKLDRHLLSFIGQPHRLGNDAVHAEAQAVLTRARSIPDPGTRLSAQIGRLTRAIEVARTPVAITLVSDNATEVTLYRLGPLGHFERHAISVIPGNYVVVGRRDGFRDVRVEFEVSPEHRDAMITVRCEEKLALGS